MDYQKYSGLSQALFEESNDAQFLLDSNLQNVLDVNAAGQRLSGFAIRDLMTMPVSRLFRYQGRPGLGPLSGSGRRAHRYVIRECELRTFQQDVWLAVDINVTRLCVKPDTLFLLKARDERMSASRIAEEHLLLKQLLAALPACTWCAEMDEHGKVRYRYLSPTVEGLLGQSLDRFEAGPVTWRDFVHSDDRALWDETWRRLQARQSTESEFRVIGKDNTIRMVREIVRVQQTPQGDMWWLFGFMRDISGTKN